MMEDINISRRTAKEMVETLRDQQTQSYVNTFVNEYPDKNMASIIKAAYASFLQDDKYITIKDVKIAYKDDCWDFSKLASIGKQKVLYTYYFTRKTPGKPRKLNEYYEYLLKFYCLFLVFSRGIHAGGNKNKFAYVRSLLFWLQDHNIFDLSLLTVYYIDSFLKERDIDYNTALKIKYSISDFIKFLVVVINFKPSYEVKRYLTDVNLSTKKAIIENNKTPLLPSSFYKKMVKLLWDVAHDNKLTKRDRGIYGLLYIESQVGLRASELLMLRKGDVVKLDYHGMVGYIMTYRTTKSSRRNSGDDATTEGQTAISSGCYEVYSMLEKMFEEERIAFQTDILVPSSSPTNTLSRIEVHSKLKDLLCKYSNELELWDRPDAARFSSILTEEDCFRNRIRFEDAKRISIPNLIQFRVYVCTDLVNRNIPPEYVSLMFAHQTPEMVGYYYRDSHNVQEDIHFSEDTVREIIENDLNILGPKGNLYKDKINGYIKQYEDKGLNIKDNLGEIIKEVCDEMPIRRKAAGFCVKSNPNRECRMDAETDRFNCAMGMCPNHSLLYFYLPQVYEVCKQEYDTILYNQSSGFINATQKSASVLLFHISHELKPVLNDFKEEVVKQGQTAILKNHPDLEWCCKNIDEIERSITTWETTANCIKDSKEN